MNIKKERDPRNREDWAILADSDAVEDKLKAIAAEFCKITKAARDDLGQLAAVAYDEHFTEPVQNLDWKRQKFVKAQSVRGERITRRGKNFDFSASKLKRGS